MKSNSLVFLLFLISIFPNHAKSQEAPGKDKETAEITRHAHLVGHEDADLMARIEEALAEWDPRHLKSPYLKEVQTESGMSYALRRPDLAEFIADPDAAVALGKALFWDMQTGSDFTGIYKSDGTKIETAYGTACASCHYRFGIDVRDRNTTAIAFQAWDKFVDHYGLKEEGTPPFDQRAEPFVPNQQISPDPKMWDRNKLDRSHDIVGSQGVMRKVFISVSEATNGVATPEVFSDYVPGKFERVDMFKIGDARVRQVTHRNSPTTINATFNDRQFHDGRAESTFNGFSIFGDFDKNTVLVKANLDESGSVTGFTPAKVSIPLASLASQAVGPVVNEVEMSHQGRTFHDLAVKLLDAEPLAAQTISEKDSVFEPFLADWDSTKLELNYRNLIRKAFRREWWAVEEDGKQPPAELLYRLLDLSKEPARDRKAFLKEVCDKRGDQLAINNFSLFWGLSIMLYESTLISNDSPFDHMLRGDGTSVEALFDKMSKDEGVISVAQGKLNNRPEVDDKIGKIRLDRIDRTLPVDQPDHLPPVLNGTAMFQRGLRVFTRNCIECHEPPTFTSAAEVEFGPEPPEPIAKIHSHSLVRVALADAFKERLITAGETEVNDTNRHLLGGRNFFFDEERLPEIEAIVGPLLIENMEIPATEPKSFNDSPKRVPMITWKGTRPDLEFTPSRGPGADPVNDYAFYDLGYYNIGTSEPRYDWGIWSTDQIGIITYRQLLESFEPENWTSISKLLMQNQPIKGEDISENGLQPLNQSLVDLPDEELARKLEFFRSANAEFEKAQTPESARQFVLPDNGLNDLGSAYRLNRAITAADLPEAEIPDSPTDHSENRNYLDPKPRQDNHFLKRARRLVMTSETWGHRKPFITDNELMGWGAFKTPTLRNVALTEPYMHNGRFLALRQTLRFYSFDSLELIPAEKSKNPGLHPEMGRLDLNEDGQDNDVNGNPEGIINMTKVHDAEALLFFLHCLTDERVSREQAPFDHPSLVIVNGYNGTPEKENTIHIGEVGSEGHPGGTVPPQFPSSADFPGAGEN